MNRKSKEELKLRYLEQLPMIAAMMKCEDDDKPEPAVSDALELIDACIKAIDDEE